LNSENNNNLVYGSNNGKASAGCTYPLGPRCEPKACQARVDAWHECVQHMSFDEDGCKNEGLRPEGWKPPCLHT
jgi:hypothetical protein